MCVWAPEDAVGTLMAETLTLGRKHRLWNDSILNSSLKSNTQQLQNLGQAAEPFSCKCKMKMIPILQDWYPH